MPTFAKCASRQRADKRVLSHSDARWLASGKTLATAGVEANATTRAGSASSGDNRHAVSSHRCAVDACAQQCSRSEHMPCSHATSAAAAAALQALGALTPPALPELRMTVKDCGSKGLGAFAAEDRSRDSGSATIEGEVIDFAQRAVRYVSAKSRSTCSISAAAPWPAATSTSTPSTRTTRAARSTTRGACLELRVSLAERRVAFYALRDIKAGDELSFDYGEQYTGARPGARGRRPRLLARARRAGTAEARRRAGGEQLLQNPLSSRRRRRGARPSTAEELARVLGDYEGEQTANRRPRPTTARRASISLAAPWRSHVSTSTPSTRDHASARSTHRAG